MANEKKSAKAGNSELQAAIQSLIAKGKKEGMIRAADLQAHLDKLDLSPETIEKIYDQLEAMNIQVVAAELDLGDDLDLVDGDGDIDLAGVDEEDIRAILRAERATIRRNNDVPTRYFEH